MTYYLQFLIIFERLKRHFYMQIPSKNVLILIYYVKSQILYEICKNPTILVKKHDI